jgi:hypothetical protein
MARGGRVYAYVMDWTALSGFDKNLSSRKSKFREMDAELPYAQAILDINELYARGLAALQPGELPRGEGKTWAEARQLLQYRLDDLYQVQVARIEKETEALATATNRGQNKKKLRDLSAEIKKRLAQLSPASGPSATVLPAASPRPQSPAARTSGSP